MDNTLDTLDTTWPDEAVAYYHERVGMAHYEGGVPLAQAHADAERYTREWWASLDEGTKAALAHGAPGAPIGGA